jgi:hypothetical protein
VIIITAQKGIRFFIGTFNAVFKTNRVRKSPKKNPGIVPIKWIADVTIVHRYRTSVVVRAEKRIALKVMIFPL